MQNGQFPPSRKQSGAREAGSARRREARGAGGGKARAGAHEMSVEISIAGEPDEHRAPRAHQAGQRRGGRPHQRGGQNSKARPPTAAPTTTTRRLLTTRRQGGGREARRHQDVHVQHGLARYANSRRSLRERHSLRSWRSLRERPSLHPDDKAHDEKLADPETRSISSSHHQIKPRRTNQPASKPAYPPAPARCHLGLNSARVITTASEPAPTRPAQLSRSRSRPRGDRGDSAQQQQQQLRHQRRPSPPTPRSPTHTRHP